MKWIIELEGDKLYLNLLTELFENFKESNELDYLVTKDNEKYCLSGKIFENLQEINLVKDKAYFVLTFIQFYIKPLNYIEPIKIIGYKKLISDTKNEYYNSNGEFIAKSEDGKYEYHGNIKLKATISLKKRISNNKNEILIYDGNILDIINDLKKSLENKDFEEYKQLKIYLKNKFDLIKNITDLINDIEVQSFVNEFNIKFSDIIISKWVKLYRILETLIQNTKYKISNLKNIKNFKKINEKEVFKFWKKKGYIKTKDIKKFKKIANLYRYPQEIKNKFSKFEEKIQVSKNELTLNEAVTLIENLIKHWIEDKINEIKKSEVKNDF